MEKMPSRTARVALCTALCLMFVAGKREGARAEVGGRMNFPFLNSSAGEDTTVMSTVRHVIVHHLQECHLILVAPRSSVLVQFIREVSMTAMVSTVIELNPDVSFTKHMNIWEHGQYTCRALLLDCTAENINLAIWFLSASKMWLRPEVRVIVMGSGWGVDLLLNNHVLRNTRHVLYIAPLATSHNIQPGFGFTEAAVYHRCLFCDEWTSAMHLTRHWNLDAGAPKGFTSFREYPKNFHGHRFQIVTLNYFPYISYKRSRDVPGNVAYLTDSLNTRMITVLASSLNFTFDVREPEDEQWGIEIGEGNWTGIVGTLQHEKADFSMDLTLIPQRAAVVEFCRVYIREDIIILSTKPRPLPEYLSLINPFGVVVWMMVVVCIFVWAVVLWLLLWISAHVFGRRSLRFHTALFYGWGLLLEDQPYQPPKEPAGQILVGMLLVTCVILRAAYTCSLTSHLVVEGKSPAINSLEELVERRNKEGWKWGATIFSGAFYSLLSTSSNPAFHSVKEHMQIVQQRVAIQRVLQDRFSYIRDYYIARIIIETEYMGDKGHNPFHISSTKYPLFAGNTWAFRSGTPFMPSFDRAIVRFLESGLIIHWMDDVIRTFLVKHRQRKKNLGNADRSFTASSQGEIEEVVLGLRHLQATLYIWIIGGTVAGFTFLTEHLFFP